MRDGVGVLVAQSLRLIRRAEFVADPVVRARNQCAMDIVFGTCASMAVQSSARLLWQLFGDSDWSGDILLVIWDGPDAPDLALVAAQSAAAIKGVLFCIKPSKPAQSRWTGVPHAAGWVLSAGLFHNFFTRLLRLTSRAGPDRAGDEEGGRASLDADAFISESSVLLRVSGVVI